MQVPLLQKPLPEQSPPPKHWRDAQSFPMYAASQMQAPLSQIPWPEQLPGQSLVEQSTPLQPGSQAHFPPREHTPRLEQSPTVEQLSMEEQSPPENPGWHVQKGVTVPFIVQPPFPLHTLPPITGHEFAVKDDRVANVGSRVVIVSTPALKAATSPLVALAWS